jgi:hypothetical protein
MTDDLTIPDFLDRKNPACPAWQPLLVSIGGAAKSPDGFIVRDCSNEED